MDPQLLHLRLNHLPVVGALWTLAFLVFALFRPSASRAKLALALTVVLAGTVVLAYLTGGPAEEKIEHLAGVVEPSMMRACASIAAIGMPTIPGPTTAMFRTVQEVTLSFVSVSGIGPVD